MSVIKLDCSTSQNFQGAVKVQVGVVQQKKKKSSGVFMFKLSPVCVFETRPGFKLIQP